MARQFNGTSDKLRTTVPKYFNSTSIIPFTIAFWFKSANTAQVQRYIAGFNGETAIIYGYVTSGGLDQVEFYDSTHWVGTNPRTGSQITIPDTNWHHIVYRYTGNGGAGVYDMFLDGVKTIINASCSMAIGTTADVGFDLGVGWGGALNFLNGSLARFIVSATTAFSDDQVQALYWRGDTAGITGVSGYWPLDGNYSPEPESSPSTNTNSLTVTGTTVVDGPSLRDWNRRVGIFSKDAVLSCGTFDMGVPNALYGWYDDDFVAQFNGRTAGATVTGITSVPPGAFSKDATLDGAFDD